MLGDDESRRLFHTTPRPAPRCLGALFSFGAETWAWRGIHGKAWHTREKRSPLVWAISSHELATLLRAERKRAAPKANPLCLLSREHLGLAPASYLTLHQVSNITPSRFLGVPTNKLKIARRPHIK